MKIWAAFVFDMELVLTRKDGTEHIMLYDECDHELVLSGGWYFDRDRVRRRIKGSRKSIYFHRAALGVEDATKVVDHKNRNPLDNRRCNIRVCTQSENMKNRKGFGKSKYLGVKLAFFTVKGKLYGPYVRACLYHNKNMIDLGRFETEEAAARAYDEAAKVYHGEFANLNFKD